MKKVCLAAFVFTMAFVFAGCGLFNGKEITELTLPASMMNNSEMTLLSDLDEYVTENGFESAEWNDDGSLTIKLTNARKAKLKKEMKDGLLKSFDNIVNSPDTSYILSIEPSRDYRAVMITANREEYENSFELTTYIIGFGGEHLDGKPYEQVERTVNAALDEGINILDLFMPGDEVRSNFGKAIAGKRDKFIIQGHIGSTDIGQQYDISRDLHTCQKYFENLLKCLNTDYIDVGMLFFIDKQEDFDKLFNSDIITYAEKLKKQGTIRAIGASSHNPLIAKKMVDAGLIELLMFSINPAFDMIPANTDALESLENSFAEKDVFKGIRQDRLELYRLCEQKDVAITVMKTLGAGKLLSKYHTPFEKPLTAGQCIHYALTRPAVVSTMIGYKSPAEVHDAVKYLKMTKEERDYTDIVEGSRKDFDAHCVYCSHCLPCPAGIDIAVLNKYLDVAKLYDREIPASLIEHYNALKSHGSDCIRCGGCENRCPFSVPIIKNMEHAISLFGR